MHCINCGAELTAGAGFCGKCGKAVGGSAAVGSSTAPASGLQSNVAGLICYLLGFITGIFFLIAEPYKRDRFVRFHALQSIFLSVSWFALYLALGILDAVLPYALWQVTWMLYSLMGLVFFVLWIFLMYKAYSHEQFKLPVIGNLAAKQA